MRCKPMKFDRLPKDVQDFLLDYSDRCPKTVVKVDGQYHVTLERETNVFTPQGELVKTYNTPDDDVLFVALIQMIQAGKVNVEIPVAVLDGVGHDNYRFEMTRGKYDGDTITLGYHD